MFSNIYPVPLFLVFSLRDCNYAYIGSSLPGLYIYHFLLSPFQPSIFILLFCISSLISSVPLLCFLQCLFSWLLFSILLYFCDDFDLFFYFTKICQLTLHFLPLPCFLFLEFLYLLFMVFVHRRTFFFKKIKDNF